LIVQVKAHSDAAIDLMKLDSAAGGGRAEPPPLNDARYGMVWLFIIGTAMGTPRLSSQEKK